MKQGFSLVLILVIVALGITALGTAFYFQTKSKPITSQTSPAPTQATSSGQPDETVYTDKGSADWKTYNNDQYKFSLKYPPNLETEKLGKEDPRTLGLSSTDFHLNIIVFKPQSYTPLEQAEGIVIDGVEASKKIEGDFVGSTQQIVVHILKNGYLYQLISPVSQTSDKEQVSKIFDQILSTFQFTN